MREYISQRSQLIRAFCSGIGKSAVIYPAAAMVALGSSIVTLAVIFYLPERFDATASQVGFLCAAWCLAYIVGCLVVRPLFARMPPRYCILLANLMMFACTAVLVRAPSLTWAFVAYGSFGLSISLFWPPLMGWLSANIEGRILNGAIGRFNLCWSAGVIVGPMIAGRLSEQDPASALRVGSWLFLLNGALILGAILALSGLADDDAAHVKEQHAAPEEEHGTLLRYPAWLGLFVAFVAVGVLLTVVPLSASRELNITRTAVGAMFLARSLANSTTLGLLGRTSFWQFRGGQMFMGIVGFTVVIALLAVARSPLAVCVLLMFTGVFCAQSYTNSLFHGISGSVRRSFRMAVHESLIGAGVVVGALIGGLSYQYRGLQQTYTLTAAIMACAALIQGFLIFSYSRAPTVPSGATS